MYYTMTKKFLIISDYKSGGAGKVAMDAGRVLENAGYETRFFFGSDYYNFSLKNYLFNRSAYNEVSKILIDYKPNIILLHNLDNLLSPLILKAFGDYKNLNPSVKIITTLHDYHYLSASNSQLYYKGNNKYFFEKVPGFFEIIRNKIDRRSYVHGLLRVVQWYVYYKILGYQRSIDHYICPSQFMYDRAIQRIDKDKVSIIHNPTDKFFLFSGDKPQQKTITFAGRLSYDKGIYQFLESFADFYHSEKIVINIVGDGEKKQEILDIREKLNAQNIKLNMHGHVDKSTIRSIYKDSHFILLPAVCYENAPLCLVEAAFANCNIITMNYGGMKEIANKFSNSILLEDFSSSEMTKLVAYLKEDKESIRLDQDEWKSFSDEYSEENYLDNLKEIFNN